jgi:hypothetical protein
MSTFTIDAENTSRRSPRNGRRLAWSTLGTASLASRRSTSEAGQEIHQPKGGVRADLGKR